MPREEYQVPTANAGQRGGTRDDHQVRHVMSYICGDCGGSVTLGKDATVACPHCAGRVLYKERTKRYVMRHRCLFFPGGAETNVVVEWFSSRPDRYRR
ncbi:hypothetical protein LB503_007254 [Fusarium chuoi]|nr:hypothetical protein LB503_007254 [Fusarium chuoi]